MGDFIFFGRGARWVEGGNNIRFFDIFFKFEVFILLVKVKM